MDADAPASTAPRLRPGQIARRALLVVTLAAIGVGTIAVVAALTLMEKAPQWWRSVDPADPATIDLAEQVERGVVSQVHRSRAPGEQWTVSVTAAQANAWLNVKLPRWMANQSAGWPPRLREVQVHFTPDERMSFGARIRGVDTDRVVAATVRLRIDDDGALWILTPVAHAGRLDLPSDWTIAQLREWIPAEMNERLPVQQVLDALAGAAPLFPEAVIKLEDGRRVRLLDLRPEYGRLLITCMTEAPEARATEE